MIKTPHISIIIPTFNRSELVCVAIESVLSQSYQNWECLIIDDFSEDNTFQIIEKKIINEPRFRLLNNDRKKGAQGARNTGISEAKGFWVVFLDSDDILSENSLEIRLNAFQENLELNPLLIYGDLSNNKYHKIIGDGSKFLNKNLALCPFSVMMVQREKIFDLELLDENFPAWQDDDLVIKIANLGNILHCGQVLGTFAPIERLISITSSKINLVEGFKQILNKHKDKIIRDSGIVHWYICRIRYFLILKNYKLSNSSNNKLVKLKLKTIRIIRKYINSKFDVICVN
jgi:glycosyltransferase involved in cell wall biosynthesis